MVAKWKLKALLTACEAPVLERGQAEVATAGLEVISI